MFATEPTIEDALPAKADCEATSILTDALRRIAQGPQEIEYPCDVQDFGVLVEAGLVYQTGDLYGLTAEGREVLGLTPARRVPRLVIRRGRFDLGTTRRPALRA